MSQPENETGQPQGMFKDVKRLRSDGTASVEELRAFLGELKGRSPQEMLGIMAESGLFRGMVSATIATVALLFVFTIGPWAYGELAGEPEQAKTATRPAPSGKASLRPRPLPPPRRLPTRVPRHPQPCPPAGPTWEPRPRPWESAKPNPVSPTSIRCSTRNLMTDPENRSLGSLVP